MSRTFQDLKANNWPVLEAALRELGLNQHQGHQASLNVAIPGGRHGLTASAVPFIQR